MSLSDIPPWLQVVLACAVGATLGVLVAKGMAFIGEVADIVRKGGFE